MKEDFLFDDVKSEVRSICDGVHHDCSFDCVNRRFYVFGRSIYGRPAISSCLIELISSIRSVSFNSVSIDKDGRLRALFYVY